MMKYKEELRETASQLAAQGKGLLAVDESTPTIGTVSYTHLTLPTTPYV